MGRVTFRHVYTLHGVGNYTMTDPELKFTSRKGYDGQRKQRGLCCCCSEDRAGMNVRLFIYQSLKIG